MVIGRNYQGIQSESVVMGFICFPYNFLLTVPDNEVPFELTLRP